MGASKGYQEPIGTEDFASSIEYHYDEASGDDDDKKGKGAKGNKNNKKQNKSENKKPAKKKEPKKVTTQSKYRKKEKVGQAQSLEENEILIKGNSQHIKKYIDRACMLLRGSDAGHPRPSKDDEKTATPSKKYDVIHLIGSGRAMGPVVSTAEIVKRIIGGLYQQTLLHSVAVNDVWVPLESGLKEVETTRPMAELRITLAVNEKDIDKASKGYQEPIGTEDFASSIEYHYDEASGDDDDKKGKGAKGNKNNKGNKKGEAEEEEEEEAEQDNKTYS